uniref:Secreted protein n=1 Tax=Macrostomum lignano TaxID=282301 RepID=A0A1I8F8G9_9PLAT
MPSSVWAEALTEMELTGGVQASQLLRCCTARAAVQLPLLCAALVPADRLCARGRPWSQVRDTCEAALNSGLHREDDIDALRTKMGNCAAAYYGVSCPEESGDDDVIASSNQS